MSPAAKSTGTHRPPGEDVVLRREATTEHAAVEALQRAAFGDPDTLPSLVAALRTVDKALPTVSIVAEVDNHIVGHTMLSHSWLDAPHELIDVYVLSPLGVHPDWQGRGIGTRLLQESLAVADDMRVPMVFLEGDPGYYADRGFERADLIGFRAPSLRIPAAAFQVARLSAYEPSMTGTLVYNEVFWALDCVGLRDQV